MRVLFRRCESTLGVWRGKLYMCNPDAHLTPTAQNEIVHQRDYWTVSCLHEGARALTWQKTPECPSEQAQKPSCAQAPRPPHVSAAVQLLQGCRLHLRWAAGRKPEHALPSAGAPVASVHVTLLVDLPPAMIHKGDVGCPVRS